MCRLTPHKQATDTAGFTLIEVVVTLAVIATILLSIGSLVSVAVRGTHALDDHLVLVETARGIEAGLPERDALHAGTMSGERDGQRWRVDVRPFPVESTTKSESPWMPLTASITVMTPDGTSLNITTLRLGRRPGA